MRITLSASLDLCTGLPFVYEFVNNSVGKRMYNPQDFIVPVDFRRFLSMRGPHLHLYIDHFPEQFSEVAVEIFLEKFPDWDFISAQIEDNDFWDEADHDQFRSALIWLASKHIFSVHWSY